MTPPKGTIWGHHPSRSRIPWPGSSDPRIPGSGPLDPEDPGIWTLDPEDPRDPDPSIQRIRGSGPLDPEDLRSSRPQILGSRDLRAPNHHDSGYHYGQGATPLRIITIMSLHAHYEVPLRSHVLARMYSLCRSNSLLRKGR